MKAKTIDGCEVELTLDMINGLRTRIRGPMLTPDDMGYEESRTVWNAMIDRKPAVVVRCLGTADVIECVRFAREWVRNAWNDMRQFSTGGTYINFLTEDEGYERIEAALIKRLQRLAAVKAKWDPENVFRTNRNILPA